ncbi:MULTISPECIES: GNAT family N-acetyltransferase [Paenibacillus]|uniref:GNAT family N-acetyltransferase n=1 Tax=Paenibacillus TaxID=44249 RepID=UPI0002F3914E|nr:MULTISPECIES: GNAT family N-acetyltransferase [Paenibacillus]KAF6584011.1 GNAT family N-acetyltransferase [Paenibacillus sp. EKM211P]MBE3647776.1 GNAT family N-acetyltransferase [Paenibacillus polymyxa]MDU8672944.1 GNAT family N-acetyltransferase [Paenibacillus polymyxa]MDU8697851.1 GNAT family N-acetyltransferase [Paenibacillus polymyxa]MEE4580122.1 GNAT family N-acetyltransferase [Paenibacillus polymyxa]
MVTLCSLEDDNIVSQIWRLQHVAYRLEAELIGFDEIPPLMDTLETLRSCGESFYGWLEDDELLGALAVQSESSGSLTLTRMMVHPDHFRKGIADSLMKHVLNEYRNVPLFIVTTGTLNTPAVTLYRKHGFRSVSAAEVAPGVELTTYHLHNVE